MNKALLQAHIKSFMQHSQIDEQKFETDLRERAELVRFYQGFTQERILTMTSEDVYEYISKLWAMLIWGNKHYVVDKLIQENGLDNFRKHLNDLVWGESDISGRWDSFRKEVTGLGPAMISEILCKTHPDEFIIWNRRAWVTLNYLEIPNLPKHDYQLTGKVYKSLVDPCKQIATELKVAGFRDTSLLAVDYFIWDQLQVAENLTGSRIPKVPKPGVEPEPIPEFIHNDIRDKIRDIGQWLGFNAKTEQKVSDGSKVDTIWEATIGNMGRVIYIFEVQTKGSIDSLMMNLLKALNNPAVQGVVAVSDKEQLEKIKSHAKDVKELKEKLKYWDFTEVLSVHEGLETVYTMINNLGLVPEGF